MKTVPSDLADERRLSRLLLDVLIRAGLILVLVMLCYEIFMGWVAANPETTPPTGDSVSTAAA